MRRPREGQQARARDERQQASGRIDAVMEARAEASDRVFGDLLERWKQKIIRTSGRTSTESP